MLDPNAVLGLTADSGADEIRSRYLSLVRQHPPDRDPVRFAEIRAAYDQLSDPVAELRRRLFRTKGGPTIESILAETQHRRGRTRLKTDTLLSLGYE